MSKELENTNKKKTVILGGSESIGVPCAVYSRKKKSFLNVIKDSISSDENNVEVIDLFNMFVNKSWNIDEILKHNLTLAEIKNMKETCINVNSEDLLCKLAYPRGLSKLDPVLNGDSEKRIVDMMKDADDMIMFYQSGSNNIMYELQANPLGALFDEKMRNRAISLMENDDIMKNVIKSMEKNIYNILSIKSDTDLHIMGLYLPKAFVMLQDKHEGFKLMNDYIKRFNECIKELSFTYDANYVDIEPISSYCAKGGLDFHVNKKGYDLLTKIAMNSLLNSSQGNRIDFKNNTFETDDTGLGGMILDANKRVNKYKNAMVTGNYKDTIFDRFLPDEREDRCKFVIEEHEKESRIYNIAKQMKIK